MRPFGHPMTVYGISVTVEQLGRDPLVKRALAGTTAEIALFTTPVNLVCVLYNSYDSSIPHRHHTHLVHTTVRGIVGIPKTSSYSGSMLPQESDAQDCKGSTSRGVKYIGRAEHTVRNQLTARGVPSQSEGG